MSDILNDICDSYNNGEKYFDVGFADARHGGDRAKPIIMMSPLESVPNGKTKA